MLTFLSVKAEVMNFVRSDLGSSTASLSWVIDGALTSKGYPAETFNETLVTRMAVAMAEDGSKLGFGRISVGDL